MSEVFARIVILALVVGVVESGFDVAGMAGSADLQSGAHEIHDHQGSDNDSPDGDDADADHYCHCVTHGAALAFSAATSRINRESSNQTFEPFVYHSLAIPPPVPPPNA